MDDGEGWFDPVLLRRKHRLFQRTPATVNARDNRPTDADRDIATTTA